MTELDEVTDLGELGNGDQITRGVDREMGVVLYHSHSHDLRAGSGLTAIPIDETQIDK